jgi:hypothetical protein
MKVNLNFRTWTWKQYAAVAGVLLGLYLLGGILLAGNGIAPIAPTAIPVNFHGGMVLGNRITTKSWSFDYDHAELSPDSQNGTVEGIRNGIVFRKGKPYLKISAERVTLDMQSLDFTAVGKVHVEMIGDAQQRSFDTDLVTWTNDAKLMHMDHPNYLHSGKQTLRIESITVDFDAETFHFGKLNGGVDIHK